MERTVCATAALVSNVSPGPKGVQAVSVEALQGKRFDGLEILRATVAAPTGYDAGLPVTVQSMVTQGRRAAQSGRVHIHVRTRSGGPVQTESGTLWLPPHGYSVPTGTVVAGTEARIAGSDLVWAAAIFGTATAAEAAAAALQIRLHGIANEAVSVSVATAAAVGAGANPVLGWDAATEELYLRDSAGTYFGAGDDLSGAVLEISVLNVVQLLHGQLMTVPQLRRLQLSRVHSTGKLAFTMHLQQNDEEAMAEVGGAGMLDALGFAGKTFIHVQPRAEASTLPGGQSFVLAEGRPLKTLSDAASLLNSSFGYLSQDTELRAWGEGVSGTHTVTLQAGWWSPAALAAFVNSSALAQVVTASEQEITSALTDWELEVAESGAPLFGLQPGRRYMRSISLEAVQHGPPLEWQSTAYDGLLAQEQRMLTYTATSAVVTATEVTCTVDGAVEALHVHPGDAVQLENGGTFYTGWVKAVRAGGGSGQMELLLAMTQNVGSGTRSLTVLPRRWGLGAVSELGILESLQLDRLQPTVESTVPPRLMPPSTVLLYVQVEGSALAPFALPLEYRPEPSPHYALTQPFQLPMRDVAYHSPRLQLRWEPLDGSISDDIARRVSLLVNISICSNVV